MNLCLGIIFYLFLVKILKIILLRIKYNKIFQLLSRSKITGSFCTDTKTTIIDPVRKQVLKILFKCFQKPNIRYILLEILEGQLLGFYILISLFKSFK